MVISEAVFCCAVEVYRFMKRAVSISDFQTRGASAVARGYMEKLSNSVANLQKHKLRFGKHTCIYILTLTFVFKQ